jgi:hypothetical protein
LVGLENVIKNRIGVKAMGFGRGHPAQKRGKKPGRNPGHGQPET